MSAICVIPFIQSSHNYVFYILTHRDISTISQLFLAGERESFWQCGREFKGANYGNYIAKIAASVFHTVYGKIG
jgi:hypothetical protein